MYASTFYRLCMHGVQIFPTEKQSIQDYLKDVVIDSMVIYIVYTEPVHAVICFVLQRVNRMCLKCIIIQILKRKTFSRLYPG